MVSEKLCVIFSILCLCVFAQAETFQDPFISPLKQTFHAGQYQKTLQLGRQILKNSPNDAEALLLTGASCIEIANTLKNHKALSGAYHEAETMLVRYIQITPEHNDPRVHISLTRCYQYQKRYPEALIQIQKAIQLNPRSAIAQYDLAGVLQAMGQSKEALNKYKTALMIEPGNAKYLEGVQQQLHKMRRFGAALEFIEQHAKEINADKQNQSHLYWIFHVSLLAVNDVDAAHEAIIKAQKIAPEKERHLPQLALSYYRKGQFEDAVKWAKRTLSHPKSTAAPRGLGSRIIGQVYLHQGKLAKAKSHLLSALKETPKDGPTILALIATYKRLGEEGKSRALSEGYRKTLKEKQ